LRKKNMMTWMTWRQKVTLENHKIMTMTNKVWAELFLEDDES